jgi:uncharacterized cupin superfamily protein
VESNGFTRTKWVQLDDWPSPGLDDHPWPEQNYLTLRVYNTALGCEFVAFSIGELQPRESVEHHHHEGGEEIYVLLEGKSQIRIGDSVIEAEPLDAFRMEPWVDRSVYNHSDELCRWIFIGVRGEGHRLDAS